MFYRKSGLALAVAVLACVFMQNNAWSLFTKSLKGFDHHGLTLLCGPPGENILDNLGQIRNNQNWHVDPGTPANGGHFTVYYEMRDVPCAMYDAGTIITDTARTGTFTIDGTTYDRNQYSRWDLLVQFEGDVVSNVPDNNNGHGNDCTGYDISNPGGSSKGKQGKISKSCQINQTCTAGRTNYSLLNFQVFCQEGVPNTGRGTGYIRFTTTDGGPPPEWSNCDTGAAGYDPQRCRVSLGGFPEDTFGVVDPAVCADLFPTTTVTGIGLATSQVLFLQQEYYGDCDPDAPTQPPMDTQPTGWPNVLNSVDRECDAGYGGGISTSGGSFMWPYPGEGPANTSLVYGLGFYGDGFDFADRICPPHVDINGDLHPHVPGPTYALASISEDLGALPPSQYVNLKCDGGSDSGQAWITVCGDASRDVRDISHIALESGLAPNNVGYGDFTECNTPGYEDVQYRFLTCTAATTASYPDGLGMAQIIWGAARDGECTHDPAQNHDTCPVGIQAVFTSSSGVGGATVRESTMSVGIQGVDFIP